ncbi:MAG: hypothetical protein M3P52_05445, partial [Actinomycetota bacterium]|nr:hypothetical protein [Actinomycetota bacterium]
MSGRRLCAVMAAIVGITACGESAATDAETSVAAATPTVQLGPMPTRPATATVGERPSTRPNAPRTTSSPVPAAAATTGTSTTVPAASPKTACTAVAYIGDSVSLDMTSSATLTSASVRFETRMAEIGVADLRVEISGGRSIVETLSGQENAVDVGVRLRDTGF